MRIATLLAGLCLIASCYIQPAQPPPAYGPPPSSGGQPSYGVAPAGSLGGQWRVTVQVPTGQPFPGTYTTTWEMTDGGGQLWASSVWSNGARSRYAGWVRGGVVHFDRTDENGFRGAFDGSLSPDGNAMSGGGSNDPSSPGGNTAQYTWTAERIYTGTATAAPPPRPAPLPPPPPAATANLSGRWQVTATVPPGQPFAGTYTSTWDLTDSGGQISGGGVWSNGARSRYAGWVQGTTVHLDRTDENGFRAGFDGSVGPDGATMSGAGRNDPASPGGNTAAYNWTARRM